MLTLQELATAKQLPIEFLQGLGIRDTDKGVLIPYYLASGGEAPRQRIRQHLDGDKRFYWVPTDAEEGTPYGLEKLNDGVSNSLIICEGESDCWTLWHNGFAALGLPGSSQSKLITPEILAEIDRLYNRIFIIEENDKAGILFAADVRLKLSRMKTHCQLYTISCRPEKDPSELYNSDPLNFKVNFAHKMASSIPKSEGEPTDYLETLLINRCILNVEEILTEIQPGDVVFENPLNHLVFTAILELYGLGMEVSYVTLLEKLSALGKPMTFEELIRTYDIDASERFQYSTESLLTLLRRRSNRQRLENVGIQLLGELESGTDPLDVADSIKKEIDKAVSSQQKVDTLFSDGYISEIDYSGIVPSHYERLNKLYQFRPKHVFTITGDTSMGKTTFALNLAWNFAARGIPVLFVSCESDKAEIKEKSLSYLLHVSMEELGNNWVSETQIQMGKELLDMVERNFFIYDQIPTLEGIRTLAKNAGWPRFIFIDYLQLLDPGKSKNSSREQQVSGLIRGLKQLAQNAPSPVTVVALSQLTKSDKDDDENNLTLQRTRESMDIANASNVVMEVWRKDRKDTKTILKLQKNRNGPVGSVSLTFEPEYNTFIEYEKPSKPYGSGRSDLD